ncbi:MAG: DUF5615 family PIN-like protein [Waterburya sp.]
MLKIAGHDVVTINELELSGSDDTIVLDCARKQERVLLTQNCRDFEALHQLNSSHPGILAIYQDNYSSKDMSFKDIAILSLCTSPPPKTLAVMRRGSVER